MIDLFDGPVTFGRVVGKPKTKLHSDLFFFEMQEKEAELQRLLGGPKKHHRQRFPRPPI